MVLFIDDFEVIISFLLCCHDIVLYCHQLKDMPESNLTLSDIYKSFLQEADLKSFTDGGKIKDFDDDSFDVTTLMIQEHDDVESSYVKSFNAHIVEQLAAKVSLQHNAGVRL
jgi:hypothetical protein